MNYKAYGLQKEQVIFFQASDLNINKEYQTTYLILTREHLIVGEQHKTLQVSLKNIESIKIEELFAHSCLVAVTNEKEIPLVYYSRAYVSEFAEFKKAFNRFLATNVWQIKQIFSLYCPKCQTPLLDRKIKCSQCLKKTHIFLRLLALTKPYKGKIVCLILATVFTVAAQMGPPYISKLIIDNCISGTNVNLLHFYILLMLGCGILLLLSKLVSSCLTSWLSARLAADLRAQLHYVLQRVQMRFYHHRESGEIIGRVMNDTGQLQRFLINGVPYLLVNSLSFVAIAIILISIDYQLALLVCLPVPFLIGGGRWFWNRLVPLFHKSNTRISALYSLLNESIYGVKVVKSFSLEKRRNKQFKTDNEKFFSIRCQINYTFAGFNETMFWIMSLGVTAVWLFGTERIVAGDPSLTLGDLLAFIGYIWLFYGPLQWFTSIMNSSTNAFASAERIFSILDEEQETYKVEDNTYLPKVQGEICFRDVRFSYDKGQEVIKGISFHIMPGEMIGLVGKSGAGKSTIMNLICHLYKIDSGQVIIDGNDLQQINIEQLRQSLGIVPQESFLFNSSIFENIRCSRPQASFQDVVRAAKAANAHDFIVNKENGYDTLIGEKGSRLSGGEKQRIAIARAILHDPPILIFDEATSSVDSQTEKSIQEAIANLVKGRTTIAIAHRLATLRHASRLFVIDDGKIVEKGSHEELIKTQGRYASLVKAQEENNQLRSKTNFIRG